MSVVAESAFFLPNNAHKTARHTSYPPRFLIPSAKARRAMDFLRNSSRLLSAGTSVLIDLETGDLLYCLSFLGRSSALLGSGRG